MDTVLILSVLEKPLPETPAVFVVATNTRALLRIFSGPAFVQDAPWQGLKPNSPSIFYGPTLRAGEKLSLEGHGFSRATNLPCATRL
jgi:hypothetical protein